MRDSCFFLRQTEPTANKISGVKVDRLVSSKVNLDLLELIKRFFFLFTVAKKPFRCWFIENNFIRQFFVVSEMLKNLLAFLNLFWRNSG